MWMWLARLPPQTKRLWAFLITMQRLWWAILPSRRYLGSFAAKDGMRTDVELFSWAWSLAKSNFIAAVRSGVTGYLLQDASASDVVAAVRAVHRGEAVCPRQLCSVLFPFSSLKCLVDLPLSDSPPKTRSHVAPTAIGYSRWQGLTNKEIASHLKSSEFTVRNHIHNILKQVDATSRSESCGTIPRPWLFQSVHDPLFSASRRIEWALYRGKLPN